MSKREFYLAPFCLSPIASPLVLLRLELSNGRLSAGWHFLSVWRRERQEGTLGQAARTCILFGKARSPTRGTERGGLSSISVSKIVAATGWVNRTIRINQGGKDPLRLLRFLPMPGCILYNS